MVCANAGYLLSNPSIGVQWCRLLFTVVGQKGKCPTTEKKTKSENDLPHEAMGFGIQIRLMKDIAPLGANLNWNDTYNVCDTHFKVSVMDDVLNK